MIQNPQKFGLDLYAVSSLADAHWRKLVTLLHRPGTFDSIAPGIQEREDEIKAREEVVRRKIEAGQFRRRPGGAISLPEDHDSGPDSFDPRQ